ncbi:MAG: type IV secretory system conjugative DNA transfer family protein [Nitrospiraceae bacterium]
MSWGQWIRRGLVLLLVMTAGIVLASEYYPDLYRQWGDAYQEWVEHAWAEWGVGKTVQGAIAIFVAPVGFVEAAVMRYFDLEMPEEKGGWRALFGLQLLILSFVFWATAISRSLRLAGIYNPFWNTEKRKRGIVLRALIKLRDWWEMATRFGREPTARWASLPEVMSHRYCAGDIFLGRPKLVAGGMLRPIGVKTEKHFLTIGGTGSGKSTAALIPNLCVHEGGLLCIDVKGELAQITARRRQGLGQDTYLVDPYGLVPGWNSCSYNPFDEMAEVAKNDPARAISYAEKIAEALVRPTAQSDSYWDNAAKTFIRGLILYIFAHEPEENRNLLRLRELVMAGDVETYEQAVKEGVADPQKVNAFDVLLARMQSNKGGVYDGAISSAAASIAMMGEGQRGSVVTTAQEQTVFLDTPEIRKMSVDSDFLLDDFTKRRISVYLIMPLNHLKGAQGRWLRMFVLLFIDTMQRQKSPPPVPVLLALDEYPALGRLEGVDPSVMRSYGVRFWAIAQDVAQLKATYPDTWTSFVGGAEAVQFMGINHPATVDFIVERLGNKEVNRGKYRELRPLLDADQVAKFLAKEKKNQIVWFGSKRPMKLKLCPYYEYLPWSFYKPDPRYKEQPLRAFWRSMFGRMV